MRFVTCPPTELDKKLADLKKDLFMLRMQHATNHLDNPIKISSVKTRYRPSQNRASSRSSSEQLKEVTENE